MLVQVEKKNMTIHLKLKNEALKITLLFHCKEMPEVTTGWMPESKNAIIQI